MAPPIFSWMEQQGVSHAANRVCADLQQARMMAIQSKLGCTVALNKPALNQYTILESKKTVDLAQYRGGVRFMPVGPDRNPMSEYITFHRRGMAAPAGDIYLENESGKSIFKIVVLAPGAIAVYRWDNGRWH